MPKQVDFERYAITHSMEGEIAKSREIIMKKHITVDAMVLDVGCGDGRHLDFLSKTMSKKNLYGTEISQLRMERVLSKGYQCAKVDSVLLPFPDNTFNVVICFEVIEHIPPSDVNMFLLEILRVLKPGGVLIGTTPNYPIKRVYDFFRKAKSRIRNLPSKKNKSNGSDHSTEVLTGNDNMKKITGLKYITHQFKRLFADDPTHLFRCNYFKIYSAVGSVFNSLYLYRLKRGEPIVSSKLDPRSLLSHKIMFTGLKVDRRTSGGN